MLQLPKNCVQPLDEFILFYSIVSIINFKFNTISTLAGRLAYPFKTSSTLDFSGKAPKIVHLL